MGAALLEMVANLTIGKKKYQSVQQEANATLDRSSAARRRAEGLVEADAVAFGHVAAAMALPRGTDEEKSERRERVQEALKGAVLPPLQTMEAALEVVSMARELVHFGNKSAVSDVGTAVLSAVAGYRAARLNVEINLASIGDQSWVGGVRGRMDGMGSPEATAETILGRVEAVIRGEEL